MTRAALVAVLALLVGASSAAADTITVVPEPAGANCTAGGVKITVTPTPPPPPDPAPPDQVSYVCSGPAGADGAPGPPGADGVDGTSGQDGLNGSDGTNGFDGQDGSSSATAAAKTPSCGKASRTVTWLLPKRFRRVASATVIVNGHRRVVLVDRGTILVDLHGLACGSYPVVVQRRGIRPTFKVFRLQR